MAAVNLMNSVTPIKKMYSIFGLIEDSPSFLQNWIIPFWPLLDTALLQMPFRPWTVVVLADDLEERSDPALCIKGLEGVTERCCLLRAWPCVAGDACGGAVSDDDRRSIDLVRRVKPGRTSPDDAALAPPAELFLFPGVVVTPFLAFITAVLLLFVLMTAFLAFLALMWLRCLVFELAGEVVEEEVGEETGLADDEFVDAVWSFFLLMLQVDFPQVWSLLSHFRTFWCHGKQPSWVKTQVLAPFGCLRISTTQQVHSLLSQTSQKHHHKYVKGHEKLIYKMVTDVAYIFAWGYSCLWNEVYF